MNGSGGHHHSTVDSTNIDNDMNINPADANADDHTRRNVEWHRTDPEKFTLEIFVQQATLDGVRFMFDKTSSIARR